MIDGLAIAIVVTEDWAKSLPANLLSNCRENFLMPMHFALSRDISLYVIERDVSVLDTFVKPNSHDKRLESMMVDVTSLL